MSLASTVVIGLTLATSMDGIQGPFEEATLMMIMIGCCIGLLVSFAVFLYTMDQNHLSTFVSTKTGIPSVRSISRRTKKMRRRLAFSNKTRISGSPTLGTR